MPHSWNNPTVASCAIDGISGDQPTILAGVGRYNAPGADGWKRQHVTLISAVRTRSR